MQLERVGMGRVAGVHVRTLVPPNATLKFISVPLVLCAPCG